MKPSKPLEDLRAWNKCKLIALATITIVLFVLSVTPAFINPVIASAQYALRIAKGTFIYNLLTTETEGALIETYIFNITNADKFLAGEDQKLKVEEIGPFTYQEFRSHEDYFLDETDNTLRYTPLISARFHRNLSVADPKDINVIVPNIPMLSMSSVMSSYPYWMQMGFNMLVNRVDAKSIVNITAHDFFWGYEEPLIAVGNTLMPGWINFKKLGMLDRLYDQTAKDSIVVGASAADKLRIKTINGKGGLTIRGYNPRIRDHCNTFEDTYEGLAFPPNLTPETKLRLYRNVFCRIMDLQYIGSKDIDFGPKAFVYRLSNTTFRKSLENECLCGKICLDGMSDLSPCFYGFGISLSQAHFLDVNPNLYERIDGMKPDFEKYGSKFIIDPNLGSVLDTRMSMQLNVMVENTDFNVRTKPFSNMIIPVFYLKIVQAELSESVKDGFRNIYFVYPRLLMAVQAVLLLAAAGLLMYTIRSVRSARLCKNPSGLRINDEKPAAVQEVLLIEENGKASQKYLKINSS